MIEIGRGGAYPIVLSFFAPITHKVQLLICPMDQPVGGGGE